MATHRVRASSPTTPRIYVDAPRASTGTILTSSFDTRFAQNPPRASFSTLSSSQSSGRNNSVYDTQPVSKRTYVDSAHPGGTISRTEYAVRPRRDSNAAENRRPLNIAVKPISPTRTDYIDSPRDMVVYGKQPRDDSTRLLQPAQVRAANEQRRDSATRADTARYPAAAVAPRVDRAYHKRGPHVEKIAHSRPPPLQPSARYTEEPTYEYTGPREQFDRDYPARIRRESLTRREKPASAVDSKFEQLPFRRDTAPPPSASRQLQRLERDDRRSGFESDPDRSRDSRRTRQVTKGPVIHQREDGYSSARDDYDPRRGTKPRPYDDEISIAGSKSRYRDVSRDLDRDKDRSRREYTHDEGRPNERDRDRDRERDREQSERKPEKIRDREYEKGRERHRPRDYEVVEEDDSHRRARRRDARESRGDRDDSPDRSGLKVLATAAVGGLAAAGIANSKSSKEEEPSESESRKERKSRRRRTRDTRDYEEDPEDSRRSRRERRVHQDDSSGSETPDEAASRPRPRSRTRRRSDAQDDHGSERDRNQATHPVTESDRRLRELDSATDEQNRDAAVQGKQDPFGSDEGGTLSPGEGEDSRLRKVSIVEPGKSMREDVKPRGILKKPREVPFPEDPNPTREGVAPLKQAGKDGVPAGARWTKVSRILVNPEALEKFHERFEERDDYVIVLRVLSREEIEKLAEKTKEIREAREREWQKQVEERKERRKMNGERDTEDEDDYDDDAPKQLAIEAPVAGQPLDLRQLAAQNNSQPQQQQPQAQAQPLYVSQQAYGPQQGYAPQQQYAPQQWQNPAPARSSAEAIAATAPGQPIPTRDQPIDTSSYSQNV